jgi:hypothetical protein
MNQDNMSPKTVLCHFLDKQADMDGFSKMNKDTED